MTSTCNVTQKEVGGKSLLLKVCTQVSVATLVGTTMTTSAPHNAKAGDVIKFAAVGANSSIFVGTYYFIKAVLSTTTFTIASTPGGSAIAGTAIEAALDADLFVNVGGIRSKSFSFSADGIDITNQDSDEWKTMLDAAGIRSCSFSGDGVYSSDANALLLQDAFMNNALKCVMLIDVKNSRIYEGCFKITSLEISGDYDGEGSISVSGDSSGQVHYQAA